MIYYEEIEELKKINEDLNKKIDDLEKLIEEQDELIFTLKQVYHQDKEADDSEGEASNFYDIY